MKKINTKKLLRILLAVGLGTLLILAIGFVLWAKTPLGPMPEALAALQSDDQVEVDTAEWLVFKPTSATPTTGVIFYPGGRVDPRSYAPAMHAIAAQGHLAVIAPMPLNLAVFAPNKANDIVAAFPGIQTWLIGGHSLGGAMAANFVFNNPNTVDGLFLWAAYPAENNNLTGSSLPVISSYGTLDGVATSETISTSKTLLPASTYWQPIDGGNHAQFGWYGDQPGDQPATISRDEQQTQATQAILDLISTLSSK